MMGKDDIEYIVFAVDHYNALGIIRGLGEDGILVNAVIIKSRIRFVPYCKYIAELYEVDSVEEGFKTLKERFNQDGTKYAILAGDDKVVSFLDLHCEELLDRYIFFNAGVAGRLTQCMDKKYIGVLAEQVGLKVPRTWEVIKYEYPQNLEYPVITKSESPIRGGWKEDVYVCYKKEDLEAAYNKIKADRVVLQHYIHKDNELALQGYSINNGKDIYISVATHNADILPDKYCSYIRVFKYDDKTIIEKCRSLMALIGFNGIFEVEFLIQDDDLYFLEINFRNTAFNYASKFAGENLNKIWPLAMISGKIIKDKGVPDDIEFTVMAEPQDFDDRVKKRRVSIIKWISQLKKCGCLFYYNKEDRKPVVMYLKNRILNRIMRH